jgi:hypothetical protein
LTVCSGSAFAASSSLQCIARQNTSPITKPISNTTDTWVRVRLYTQGNGNTYYVKGSDIVAFKRSATTAYMGSSDWQPFNINSNTAGVVNSSTPNNPQLSNPAKYAAIRVDANGNIVGIGASGGGSAIAGSCWYSFAAAA